MKHRMSVTNLQRSRLALAGAAFLGIVQIATAAPAAEPPINDDCLAATVAGDLPFVDTVDVSNATTVDSDPLQSCTTDGASRNAKSVWYSFTASQDGDFIAATGGSDFDTVLTGYTGTCPALTEAQCNDDSGSFGQSRISFHATAGQVLRFEVTAFNDDGGTLIFTLRRLQPAPSNDACAAATAIGSVPFEDTVDTTGATSAETDPVQACSQTGTANANTVWYSFTAPSAGAFIASTRQSDYDTVLSAYTGTCPTLTAIACSDDIGGPQSGIRFTADSGQTVLLEVTDFDGATSGGTLTLDVVAAGPAQSVQGSITDPQGDTFGAGDIQPDLASYAACSNSTAVQITATFTASISSPASDNPNAIAGYIDLDVDRSAATGVLPFTDFLRAPALAVSSGMGTDFFVDLFTFDAASGRADVVSAADGTVTGQASVTVAETSLTVVVPLALIGSASGVLNTAAVLGSSSEATDVAPNEGSVTTTACVCVGDCDGNQRVTVDEILLGVNLALSGSSVESCPVFDSNKDSRITIDEILTSVQRALNGCS